MGVRRLVAGVVAAAGVAAAATYVGRVVGVIDGDTIAVMRDGKADRVRLADVDAPEKRQPYGMKARKATGALAYGKDVTVEAIGTDRYGRSIGRVTLPDGRVLNRELVGGGQAWWYEKYSTDPSLGALERQARQEGKGLWSDPNAAPPWEFRHSKKGGSRGERTADARSVSKGRKKKGTKNVRACGGSFVCGDFARCDDAVFQLTKCGVRSLDNDRDGVPCEAGVCAEMTVPQSAPPPRKKK